MPTNLRAEFWQELQTQVSLHDPHLQLTKSAVCAETLDVFNIQFLSIDQQPIHGILITPKGQTQYPLVIDYLGYMNYIADPMQFYHWPSIGCACLVIDNRDQGGLTTDYQPYTFTFGDMPMGRGFTDANDFYMRRVIADHLVELKIAHDLPATRDMPLIIRGASQGGGLAITIGSLAPYELLAIFADVPSASNIANRIAARTGSYGIMSDYLAEHPEMTEQVLDTVSYFDTQYLAPLIKAPVYASVGDQDTTCPPADFQVTYAQIAAPKELVVYHGHAHEGGGIARTRWEVDKAAALLK